MKIGILTQWYDPEPGPAALPGVLARELVRRGHEVRVLTGFPNYPTGKIADGYKISTKYRENLDGVDITRTFLLPQHGRSGIGRIANYLSFGLSAAIFGRSAFRDIDVLWVNYSPITVALPMWLQRLTRRTPIICEVADLWPDTMLVSGLSGSQKLASVAGPVLNAWTNAMYRSSESVVHISKGVGSILAARGVAPGKIHYVPKPADEKNFHTEGSELRAEFGITDDQIVILYAGSMGTAQSLDSLIEALGQIESQNIRLIMAGSGTEENSLRRRADGDDRIQFIGRQPMERMADLLATADIAYVGLADHPLSHVTMPSKTQTILASGKAVVVAASGDVADVIEEAKAGFAVKPGDTAAIADALDQAIAMGRDGLASFGLAAREYYAQTFSVNATTDAIEQLLLDASGKGMDSNNLGKIRLEDVDQLAVLHRQAFPGYFLSRLGESFLRQFYRGFLNDPSAITCVARDNSGNVLGAAVGSADPNGFFGRLLRRRWFGFALSSLGHVLRSPKEAPRLLRAVAYRGDSSGPISGALLSSIFVAPGGQGSGIGKGLLQAWVREASASKSSKAFLSTDAEDNEEVRRFYESNNWFLDRTYSTREGRSMAQYSYVLTADDQASNKFGSNVPETEH